MATPMRKFLFDRSFDPETLEAERLQRLEEERRRREAEEAALYGGQPEPEPEPEPEPPAPTFSEEELDAARRAAFEEGRQAGEAAALQSKEEAMLALMKGVAAETADITRRQDKANAELGDTAVQVALAVCAKMLPRMMARHGGDEIEDLIRHCLADLMEEPRVVIRVADDMLDDLHERSTRLKAETGFPGTFVLLADSDLATGDARVEWADGGAERLAGQVWRDVEQAIARVQAGELTTPVAVDDGIAGRDESVDPPHHAGEPNADADTSPLPPPAGGQPTEFESNSDSDSETGPVPDPASEPATVKPSDGRATTDARRSRSKP